MTFFAKDARFEQICDPKVSRLPRKNHHWCDWTHNTHRDVVHTRSALSAGFGDKAEIFLV